jgi:hypothetical protein
MERVSAVLAEARAAGLTVRVDADRLVVRGPKTQERLAQQLLAYKPGVLALLRTEDAEITWRLEAMQPQVPRSGPLPFLVARDVAPAVGQCLSCGDPLTTGRTVRCALCVRAVQLVLGWVREGVDDQP